MLSPLKPCADPRCGVLIRGQAYCAEHSKARENRRKAQVDRERPHSRARGYTRAWERFRKWYLAGNPMCERPGCYDPATEVDHIIPLAQGGSHCDENNSQALCKRHHSMKTAKQSGFNAA